MGTMDLKMRVISNLSTTQQIMLYQKDIKINVTNYKIGAWEAVKLAPGSIHTAVLPMDIEVAATDKLGRGNVITKQLPAATGDVFTVVNNGGAIDIEVADKKYSSGDGTVDIYNAYPQKVCTCVTKDGKPLFACETRPEYRVNFIIKPKVYVALSDVEITGEYFDATTLSANYKVDYTNQAYLTLTLDENVSTGAITISHNFEKFD
ncbi:MAG: hypothetical protein LBL87_07105 [Ruminococcus sp.]|jgi:hypothetical protein|nr:hypothetical protein [Ruminococcus sp.]